MSTKVALVMGGGAGTGRATVLAFGKAGYRVAIADINSEGGEKSLQELEAAVQATVQPGQLVYPHRDGLDRDG